MSNTLNTFKLYFIALLPLLILLSSAFIFYIGILHTAIHPMNLIVIIFIYIMVTGSIASHVMDK